MLVVVVELGPTETICRLACNSGAVPPVLRAAYKQGNSRQACAKTYHNQVSAASANYCSLACLCPIVWPFCLCRSATFGLARLCSRPGRGHAFHLCLSLSLYLSLPHSRAFLLSVGPLLNGLGPPSSRAVSRVEPAFSGECGCHLHATLTLSLSLSLSLSALCVSKRQCAFSMRFAYGKSEPFCCWPPPIDRQPAA